MATAQVKTTAAAAQSASGYHVAGVVVNAVTGDPVRGASVALLTVEDSRVVASAESGDDGGFALAGLPAAKFQLTASKRGYVTGFYDQHQDYNSAIVTGEGQDTSHLVFKLAPTAVLSGVVTGDGGDAVEGATVMLFEKPHRHEPGERIEQTQTAQTDDTGAYEFSELTAGEYLVAVKAKPWYALPPPSFQEQETEAQAALDVAYPVTFFDSTTDAGSATPIVLSMGSHEEADLSLHALPALRLEVAAPRKQDGSIARPELKETIFGVAVESDEPDFADPGVKGGVAELAGVAPGHYELTQGDPPRVVELDATGSQQVDPNAGTPTSNVSGTVQSAPGEAFAGPLALALEPADGAGTEMGPFSFSGGSFKFNGVPQGSWLVEAESSNQPLPVLSIASAGKAHAGNRITVEDKPLALVVTVSASNTRVEGFARKDGKGVAGAMVVLMPKDATAIAELARRDQSDSDGSFALLNVAPGEYTAVAIEDAWEMNWADPAVMARYLPRGIAVTVTGQSNKLMHLAEPVPVQAR